MILSHTSWPASDSTVIISVRTILLNQLTRQEVSLTITVSLNSQVMEGATGYPRATQTNVAVVPANAVLSLVFIMAIVAFDGSVIFNCMYSLNYVANHHVQYLYKIITEE